MSKIVAIIPARGGSKGVVGKNIKPINGIPLIGYTIKAALESQVDRVIVSTDDTKIAEVAKQFGAEVPFIRPSEFATDTASSLSVIEHAIDYMENVENYIPEVIVFLQPTSPFRRSLDIDGGIQLLNDNNVDSVLGVRKVEEEHPYFMYHIVDERWEEYVQIPNKPARRQDVPGCYLINSALYISKREYFNDPNNKSYVFNMKSFVGYIMDKKTSFDINDEFDFKVAEMMADD